MNVAPSRCPACHKIDCHCPKTEQTKPQRSSSKWYSNVRWKRFRTYHLQQHPLCEDCMTAGRTTVATSVHHVNKVEDTGDVLEGPFMSLCIACHSIRTARGE